ncbi:nascent polypeptide-associated complex subunit alpha-like protein 2 [Tanacetum coccineum]
MLDMSSLMAKSDPFVISAAHAIEEEKEVNEIGVEPRDINLVMTQAGVSRPKDVMALQTHNGDISSRRRGNLKLGQSRDDKLSRVTLQVNEADKHFAFTDTQDNFLLSKCAFFLV